MPFFDVTVEAQFCAAHALRAYKGATEPTHGHNFRVLVTVTGRRLDRAGVAVDFLDLKPRLDEELGRLHHVFLNEAVSEFRPGRLSPSAENIARVLFRRLKPRLSKGVRLSSVEVFESPGCSARYRER